MHSKFWRKPYCWIFFQAVTSLEQSRVKEKDLTLTFLFNDSWSKCLLLSFTWPLHVILMQRYLLYLLYCTHSYELSSLICLLICLYFNNLPSNSCLAAFLHQRFPITTHLAHIYIYIYSSAIVSDYLFNCLCDKLSSLWSTDLNPVVMRSRLRDIHHSKLAG